MGKSNGSKIYNEEQLHELLYQALETEIGGIDIYTEAVKCAINDGLKDEWKEYLDETKSHRRTLEEIFGELGLDPKVETPGRKVVRLIGESLVDAMKTAREAGNERAAELVATECVVLAETKDHLNWTLLAEIAKQCDGDAADLLYEACEEVEDQEDHHLYHTRGYCRELWLKSLGLPAVLPPPEEVKNVETAIGAARAAHQREKMIDRPGRNRPA
jgi:rubrerythrin